MVEAKKIAVIGAGSWGTALAMVIAKNGYHVDLYTRRIEQMNEINENRTNTKYLKGIKLPSNITASTSLEDVIKDKKVILVVVPSHTMRGISKELSHYINDDVIIVHATKGLEIDTYQRMSEVILNEIPQLSPENVLVLSGPSHAEEVSKNMPTTVVVAGEKLEVAEYIQDILMNNTFRVYTNLDLTGVEIAGALKNIIALGAGLNDGLNFGDNSKAALMTRGLAEIARLGLELGANPLTFSGLAGVGDLIVTCTSQHSRNWRAGYRLGQGKGLQTVLEEMGMVVEGIKTTKAAFYLSKKNGVSMPITNELYHVLFEEKTPKQAVEDLMGRVKTHEMEEVSLGLIKNE